MIQSHRKDNMDRNRNPFGVCSASLSIYPPFSVCLCVFMRKNVCMIVGMAGLSIPKP